MRHKKFKLIVLLLLGFGLMGCQTTRTFTDSRDSKVYKTIKIGEQWWMSENLAYAPSNGNYWAYDNNDANVETYGYLYDWETAKKVCPTGWHLPTDDEWKELEMTLGMSQAEADDTGGRGTDEGSKLAGNAGLWTGGGLENDSDFGTSGFTALPGGCRDEDGVFYSIGNSGYWWSATEDDADYAWNRLLYYYNSYVSRDYDSEELGISVRCLRD
ncbi:MAG: FISUMP domain-containing protein [Bacteroidota bacterium]|nr:FISUMP domain-containing protein [Bacteroidota bacterium]